jgi:hypothetical protein
MKTLPQGIFTIPEHKKEILIAMQDDNILGIDVWNENANVDNGESCLCSFQIDLKNNTVNIDGCEFKVTLDINIE